MSTSVQLVFITTCFNFVFKFVFKCFLNLCLIVFKFVFKFVFKCFKLFKIV